MLQVVIPAREYFDSSKNEFVYLAEQKLTLEHSLISISKWESKWKKPFLDDKREKTREESVDYIRCMSVGKPIDNLAIQWVPQSVINQINEYISDPMTATWFNEQNKRPGRQVVTSELVYYWMIAFHVPMECEKWHFNRLLTLIKICELKNAPKKRMKRKDVHAQYMALNAARKKQLEASGGLP